MPQPTVAVVGGGQLARMMQQAAIGLQVHLVALVEDPGSATAQVVPDSVVGAASDGEALTAIASRADVLTFEHEHVPNDVLAAIRAAGHAVEPGPEALLHAQDKIAMRERLTALDVPCPRWAVARTPDDVAAFGARVGWPVVAKTPRGGYDGKGVAIVHDGEQVPFPIGPDTPVLLEERVPFTRELAALVARRPSGEMRTWPVVQTIQRDGVCAEVLSPAPDLDPSTARAAEGIARLVAEGLGVTGVLAVELFLEEGEEHGGRLSVNELAMRPHNSGHVTIDAHTTSQFEQHLRAVLDLPLGATDQRERVAVMANLLGSELAEPTSAYPALMAELPGVKVHLYGKEVRPGRKLGHVTAVGDDLATARAQAARAVALLSGED
ncbi:5-(carboxyamino)imidazole ribonucleotide synthase [Miniimonas sp. S16]|uniref:5-(carboxyamino)imidazole ribonucleotide synthase n=1 Tax=Miniimonas sp. S16 TaxID=2171623 RepID=UPI000D5278DD|nr:5-(carboxyamino)imidazole ribonucleotide synthase [Miniimonas sp. S16]